MEIYSLFNAFLFYNEGPSCEMMTQEMEGYSGSDIRLTCKEAAMRPVRKIFDALESHQDGKLKK